MLKTYLTVAWRSLVRNKVYSLVNVMGLALGICACLAIYLITRHELSFDTFHPDRNRIFVVDAGTNGGHWNCVPGPMATTIRREMSGLQTVAAFQSYAAGVAVPGNQHEKWQRFADDGSLAIAEPQYFDIFNYQWLSGNAATSLTMPHTVVLTEAKAKKYFGDVAPDQLIGRTLYYQDSLMVTVTGIVADWTGNSDYNYSQWISYATIPVSFLKNEITLDKWNEMILSNQCIVKLAKGVRPSQIDAQFKGLAKRYYDTQLKFAAQLKPLSGVHFHREYGGRGRKASLPVLYTLIAVAGFILVLAIVNFINLSTAQSMQRAKEIGVRKVMGGNRSGIAVQFFTETLVLTIAAVLLAVLIIRPVLGLFASFIPPGIHFETDGPTLIFLLLIAVATTFLAGLYPARVLGTYQPTLTLKGITAVPGGEKGRLRSALIVFQFSISLLFIIASLVIGRQLRYALHTDLGFKTDAILTIHPPHDNRPPKMGFMSDRGAGHEPEVKEKDNTAILMNKIRQLPGVEQVIREGGPPLGPGHGRFGGSGLKNSNEKIEASFHSGNDTYVPFYGMKLVAGRNLFPGDSSKEVLISETFARTMGFTDVSKALGQEIAVSPFESLPVVGVLADFYETSFHEATYPILLRHNPRAEIALGVKIAAKDMTAGEIKTLIGRMEQQWKTVYPEASFEYEFLDESIARRYTEDLKTELLTNVAMGITVFISCLGLLGLAIFSTQKRTREIGIRKVLGASVSGIIVMLCKEIVWLIVIALVIATPLAWYCMHQWLQDFAYRTPLSAWLFIAAGAAAIAIALLTVGFQAMKAARANPVKALRTE